MRQITIYIFSILISLLNQTVFGQYYDSGQDPWSVKYRQIQTEHFQVVFPQGLENEAQRVANLLSLSYDYVSSSLGHKPKKISVLIHNKSVISNAWVGWAPKRMELFTNPPQDNYSQDWMEQLAIHELRHVVQMDKMNQGMTKLLGLLFGQQASAAIIGIYVPLWLIEGDAVLAETALSNSGRGRTPGFEAPLRSQVIEKGNFHYDKAVFGSYKDNVPNHYEMGYQMVAGVREKYGKDVWEKSLNRVARNPFGITPFRKSLKKSTGKHTNKLYNEIFTDLEQRWEEQQNKTRLNSITQITLKPKLFTNYKSVNILNDSSFIVLKQGISTIPQIVEVAISGKERIIHTPSYLPDNKICYSNGNLVWAEKRNNPRWEHLSYSELKLLEYKTGEIKTITRKTRFFAPDLKPDSDLIVASFTSEKSEFGIVILNQKGKIIKKISTSDNQFIATPTWSEDGKYITAVAIGKSGKSIIRIDWETEEIINLLPPAFNEISDPFLSNSGLYFIGSYSGINNYYLIPKNENQIFQITSSAFGVTDPPIIFSKKIIYSDYNSMGFRLVMADLDSLSHIPLNQVENHAINLFIPMSNQEPGVINFDSLPKIQYPVKNYSKALNLFGIHSWGPVNVNSNGEVASGFSILSQNLLGTMFATAGYTWENDFAYGDYFANVTYKGFYPIIDFMAKKGKRHGSYSLNNGNVIDFTYKETSFEPSISIPFNYQKNQWIYGVYGIIGSDFVKLDELSTDKIKFRKDNYYSSNLRLYFYNQSRKSRRDLYPKFGQILDLNYKNTIFDPKDKSSMIAAELILYFPGLFKHHGLRIYTGIQDKLIDDYFFSDLVNYPRGISNAFNDALMASSATYRFPILYPDFRLGSLFFLQRIKCGLFFDWAQGNYKNSTNHYQSSGIELIGDFHFLRFIAPIDFGFRASFVNGKTKPIVETIITINFDEI